MQIIRFSAKILLHTHDIEKRFLKSMMNVFTNTTLTNFKKNKICQHLNPNCIYVWYSTNNLLYGNRNSCHARI